ncbi:insulinase like protease [Cryptosporidium sp. chipmunk genotype I]|uniref:insulinase like protease n=1 Tax=Cryptosporidium sp. chipmunk genotype I TaxID=1280935 RepID=UPI00351A084E|nr:insulinase like protease [Cryptosporidium sp. chipmunk genotype I]
MLCLLLFIIIININNEVSLSCSSSNWKSGYSILKPKTDDRNYKNITLRNGITALLIEDKFSERAGFTAGIKVGSFNDPIYALGLFHLIEHVLFLGSKKYPAPESYDEFMTQHGGRNNAYTSEERTIYFNEIGEEYLEEGLDHFSHFFIDPLFYEKIVDKEIHIVNSEHLKNIPNELDRLFHTLKAYTYNPMSQFTTGNIETLVDIPNKLGISIPKLIKKMYKKYYCGANMFFVLSSKRSLIDQEKLLKKYFSAVLPDNDGQCEFNSIKIEDGISKKSIVDQKYLGKKIHIKSLSGRNLLWIIWSFPTHLISPKKQPLIYLSYILNSKHKSSLFWLLQKNNYITNSNSVYENYSFGSIFIFQLELTSEGIKKQLEIIGLVYKYINKLKESNELLEIYQGVRSLTEREFITNTEMVENSPMYYTSEICSRMIQYGAHAALSGDILIEDVDENLISEILNTMSPFNTLFLTSDGQEFSGTVDKIFHVKHTIEEIPNKILNDWKYSKYNKQQEIEIKLPTPEKCSPINLRIVQETEDPSSPQRLDSILASIWWNGPVKKSHKIGIKILLKFPRRYYKGIETQVWGEIITYILNTLIKEKIERYSECGMTFYIEWDVEGIIINIDTFGYSNDIDTFLNEIVAPEIANISNFDCEIFNEMIAELNNSKHVLNSGQDTTYSKIMFVIKSLQTNGEYTEWEYRNFINRMFVEIENNEQNSNRNRNRLASFIFEYTQKLWGSNSNKEYNICGLFKSWTYKLLHRQSIIAYLQGNVSKNKSLYLIEKFVLNSKVLSLNNKYSMKKKVHKLVRPIDITVINPVVEDINNTVLTFYQFGVPSFEEKLHLMALQPIIQGYIYDNLRINKQLGYIIFANIVSIGSSRLLVVGVEGDNSNSVEKIELSIHNTLYEFSTRKLGNMESSMFEDMKSSLIQEIKSIENSFNQKLNHYWNEIRYVGNLSEGFNLHRAINYINNNMTIEHLYNTFSKLINSGKRAKSYSTIKAIYYPKVSPNFEKQEFIDEYMNNVLTMARRSVKENDFY